MMTFPINMESHKKKVPNHQPVVEYDRICPTCVADWSDPWGILPGSASERFQPPAAADPCKSGQLEPGTSYEEIPMKGFLYEML